MHFDQGRYAGADWVADCRKSNNAGVAKTGYPGHARVDRVYVDVLQFQALQIIVAVARAHSAQLSFPVT